MKVNDILYGFKILSIREVEDLQCNAYEMMHCKSKAKLLYLDRKDVNKTFCIGFKTTPEDHTGVFHILEHSVLNGSQKYPLKEPFVELLKGSLATFLNAMTFPDKTLYPVSSKNETDFMNLMDVYLDAVFHPLIYKKPNIFYQEGWHYDVKSMEEEVVYKGVVYNEMQGAMSSVNEIVQSSILKQLFPDTVYQYNSGGDPKYIPDLTYEKFIETHKKYYHPSNSYIVLDGQVNLEKSLERIHSYLDMYEYEEKDFTIKKQKPLTSYNKVYYELSESEDMANKTHYTKAKIVASYEEKEKLYAISLINEVIAGNNDSCLVKAILEKDLGNDVVVSLTDEIAQPILMIEVKNSEENKVEEIEETIKNCIETVLEKGLEKQDLIACLNRMHFSNKSQREPRGIYYVMNIFTSWLHGGDPLLYLRNEEMFASLREKINTNYYDDLLREVYLEGDFAHLLALPTKEKEKEETIVLSEKEKQLAIENTIQLERWQMESDSEEALATLPHLPIESIEENKEDIKTNIREINGVKVLEHAIHDQGIVHVHLYFNMADLDLEMFAPMRFITSLYGNVPTEKYDVETLQRKIKTHIGRIAYGIDAFSIKKNLPKTKPYFVVSFSALETEIETAFELVEEIIMHSQLKDEKRCKELLSQYVDLYRQSMIHRGDRFALYRVAAHTIAEAVVKENCGGYSYYRYLSAFLNDYENKKEAFFAQTDALIASIVSSSKLTISSNTPLKEEMLNTFISKLNTKERIQEEALYTMNMAQKEGVLIPSAVSYAVLGGNFTKDHHVYKGSGLVLENYLTYDYLWNKVRVQGGAYGTGIGYAGNGNVAFTSYRDPSAHNSLKVYREATNDVREFLREEESIEKFIIGALQIFDPLLTPLSNCKKCDSMYFCEFTKEEEKRIREEVIHTSKEDLLNLCESIESIYKQDYVCVFGNKEALDACSEEQLTILEL